MSQQNPNDELQQLIDSSVLGKQIESFVVSDVGKYLQTRAKRVYNAAIDEFKSVDPTDTDAIRKIQTDIWKAEAFMGWLGQGIQEGLTALGILEGIEDDPQNL
jgi:hypothetical protein